MLAVPCRLTVAPQRCLLYLCRLTLESVAEHKHPIVLPAGVAPDAPLMDSGLDSLGAVEFRSSLENKLSMQLPPTLVSDQRLAQWMNKRPHMPLSEVRTRNQQLICCIATVFVRFLQVFDYPSLSAIVGYLDSTMAQPEVEEEGAAPSPVAAPGKLPGMLSSVAALGSLEGQRLIVVSATHGRFPDPPAAGGADDAPTSGLLHDVISVVPMDRYDVEVQLTQDMPARFGGFLSAVQVRHGNSMGQTASRHTSK